MKRYPYLIFMLPFLLWLVGCEQERPDVLEKLIFSDDDQWLERDTVEDPFELVGSQCCNDYNPHPLPIDTTIHPVIDPAGDLDYFDLQIAADSLSLGQLQLQSDKDNIIMRIFNRNLEEYEFRYDTFYNESGLVSWTTLYGLDPSFTLLVKGESRDDKGMYDLGWNSVILEDGLKIKYPKAGDRWRRSNWEIVTWASVPGRLVTAALIRGPVIIRFLKSGSDATYSDDKPGLDWHIPDDIDPGTQYRIMIYFTANPKRMNISDEFEIYY